VNHTPFSMSIITFKINTFRFTFHLLKFSLFYLCNTLLETALSLCVEISSRKNKNHQGNQLCRPIDRQIPSRVDWHRNRLCLWVSQHKLNLWLSFSDSELR
jgi:hypothetical protein